MQHEQEVSMIFSLSRRINVELFNFKELTNPTIKGLH